MQKQKAGQKETHVSRAASWKHVWIGGRRHDLSTRGKLGLLPPPCGGGLGEGGGAFRTVESDISRPPPPTPPHKGEGSTPSLLELYLNSIGACWASRAAPPRQGLGGGGAGEGEDGKPDEDGRGGGNGRVGGGLHAGPDLHGHRLAEPAEHEARHQELVR